jgi:hypothetical protein
MADHRLKLPDLLTGPDYDLLIEFIGGWREPDLTIAPDAEPYLHRWHVIPRNDFANVYLHVQVGDDPERPMHDHEYDNQSVILAGGYVETYQHVAHGKLLWEPSTRIVHKGMTVHRKAEEAHRLKLLPDAPYAITLFTTGPRQREWGFWLDKGWTPWHEVTEGDYREGGVSTWKKEV